MNHMTKTAKTVLLGAALLAAPAMFGAQQAEARHKKKVVYVAPSSYRSGSTYNRYNNGRGYAYGHNNRYDFDRDGVPNYRDRDDDNDGVRDSRDRRLGRGTSWGRHRSTIVEGRERWADRDRDGIPNYRDRDLDGDGRRNGSDDHPFDRRKR
jgi:hypothetical protein